MTPGEYSLAMPLRAASLSDRTLSQTAYPPLNCLPKIHYDFDVTTALLYNFL